MQGVAAFGTLVRSYRLRLSLTQEDLAERAGLSERSIRAMERGSKHVPRKETVQLLAEALELGGAEREGFQLAARRIHAPGYLDLVRSVDQGLDSSPTNPPYAPTPFIGRKEEMARLLALLQQPAVRLLTLTGPGGIGKTRLALQVAERLRDARPDGVYFVSLASLKDPGLVPGTIALAVGLQEQAGQRLLDTLTAFFRSRRLLLVLDNYEHLLPAAEVVSHLLAACAGLQILVTSRAILHLAAEHEYSVPPLTVPSLTNLTDLEALAQVDAVALFLERAQAVQTTFTLSEHNARTIAEICSRLDGLPLAIELAAARLRLFPPQGLLNRLSQRLDLLTGGARDRPERHQTLRGAIDWSYSLLDATEQTLFARLSVFAGSWTLEAAESVCNPTGEPEIDVLGGMASLVEQSLIRQQGEDEPRFAVLETIRQYAAEQLEHAGDAEGARQQHSAYYLRLAQEAEGELSGPRRARWLERLECEHDNLRAALARARQTGDAEGGLRLAGALNPFWEGRGYIGEGRRWFNDLLALDAGPVPVRAVALESAARLARAHSDWRGACELLEQSLNLARELGDKRVVARLLIELGWMESGRLDFGRAAASLESGLALARTLGDRWLICSSLHRLASVKVGQEDVPGALPLAEESLQLARELGDLKAISHALSILIVVLHFTGDVGRAGALLRERLALMRRSDAYLDADGLDEIRNLGFTARGWGEYETASELWERAVVHYLQTGDRGSAARIRVWLALLEREQGRYARARTILEESLGVSQELEDPEGIATALVALGDVARDQGDAEQTIAFSERGLALTRERGDTLMMGYSLHNLALAAWMQGDHARAEQLLEEALTVVAADCLGGDSKSEVLISSGVVALDGGKTTHAEQAFVQSLQFVRGRNLVWLAAPALEGMAGVAARHGETPRAAHLLGAADGLRSRMGTPVMPLHRALYDRHVAAARGALGAERFEALWEEGRAMTVEQAFALALDGLPSMHGSLPTPPIPA